MIKVNSLINVLKKNNSNFFTGVPDSVLNSFIFDLDSTAKIKHIPTINEGSAVAIASGYYLATKKIPLVYMQNSGLCNALNPLLSIVDEKVFSFPQIVLVGRRGAPGIKDEPQHAKIGPKTIKMLESLNLKYFQLKAKGFEKTLKNAVNLSKKKNKPVFLVVCKGFFKENNKPKIKNNSKLEKLKRINYLENLIEFIDPKKTIIFSSLGNVSREMFYLNTKNNLGHSSTFYGIGAMGHLNQIALGYSYFLTNKKIIILDGDGSIQMQLGNLLMIGESKKNLLHIVFNNQGHESTGGHKLGSMNMDYKKIFEGMGYDYVKKINSIKKFREELINYRGGSRALIVEINQGSIKNLPRPNLPMIKLKNMFLKKKN